jgi:hypothetical protein
MSSHFKKFLSQRKSSNSPVFQNSPAFSSSASSDATLVTGSPQGSPQLINFNDSPTPPPHPSNPQILLSQGHRAHSPSSPIQTPNQLDRSTSYTHVPPDPQLAASLPMREKPHSSISLPIMNTQQSASHIPRQTHGAATPDPPRHPNYAQPQHSYPPATPQSRPPFRPGEPANVGGKKQPQLIVGIDFVCAGRES